MRPVLRPVAAPIAALLALLAAAPAAAQDLPPLTGRVVDRADLLNPQQEAQVAARLERLERETSRQVVVVTVPDLQGYSPEDFAFRLGEEWKIGNEEADNGAILLVARDDRRIRIEVGDGLEGILPDALAYFIIRDRITPAFKQRDFAGGINAGVDGIVEQLQAPLEVAEERALQAVQQRRQQQVSGGGDGAGSILPLLFWGFIIVFIILPALFGRGGRGRRYRRRRRGIGPVIIWGGGTGWGGGGAGWGSGGGGFGGGGGGFGGFSGGGGSFGGGGASGSW